MPPLASGAVWEQFVGSFHLVLGGVSLALLLGGIGVGIGRMRPTGSNRWKVDAVGTAALVCVGYCVFMLCRGPVGRVPFAVLVVSLPLLAFVLGCRFGFFLREPGVVLVSILVLLAALALFMISSPRLNLKTSYDKEELRDLFKDATGAAPDDNDKKNFWQGQVDDDRPPESRKKEYWRGE